MVLTSLSHRYRSVVIPADAGRAASMEGRPLCEREEGCRLAGAEHPDAHQPRDGALPYTHALTYPPVRLPPPTFPASHAAAIPSTHATSRPSPSPAATPSPPPQPPAPA